MKSSAKELPTDGGFILSYELTEPIFQPVLELAGKGERGWKLPTFIESLINNPAPLLLEDRWLYDQGAVKRAFGLLSQNKVAGLAKLEYVLQKSPRFEPISAQSYFNSIEDVEAISETMQSCNTDGFRSAIGPLNTAYGNYAFPNNYEFERMNAGIIRQLSRKNPNIHPMDDSLRIPVYDWLGNTSQVSMSKDVNLLDQIIGAAKNSLFPIPKYQADWDPVEFVKLHKSKGAQQLRELIHTARSGKNIETIVQNARTFSISISPTREVVYALSGLGASTVSAIQSISNPVFYIPTAIFTVVSADQLYMTFESWQQKGHVRWLEVADQLAAWYTQKCDLASS